MQITVGARMTSSTTVRAVKRKRQRRDWLVESIRTYLLPALVDRGFEAAPRLNRGLVDREYTVSLPLGRLLRERESRLELAEIQFAPYGRAAFRINAGVPPKEGIATFTGRLAPEELDAGGLPYHFEMYAWPRWSIWFSVWRWPGRSLSQANYDKLAIRVASFVPELELALREGSLGPHIRKVVIPHPSSGDSFPLRQ